MTIAASVIQTVTERAKREGARKVTRIDLEIGELAGVMVESLEFCFDVARKNTLSGEATLNIISVPATGRCEDCGHQFHPETHFSFCPECSGCRVSIEAGMEMKIKSFNYE